MPCFFSKVILCLIFIHVYYRNFYDKESIYPENFVSGILLDQQTGEGQKIVTSLRDTTQIKTVPVYESLIREKNDSLLYYKVKDPGHWNERGAFVGYRALIETVKKDFPNLTSAAEQDYVIKMDTGFRDIYGMRYPYPEESLTYALREPKAVEYSLIEEDPDLNSLIRYKEHTHFYKNDQAQNNYKILLIGDSFIRQFIKDDISEHFQETLSIDWLNIPQIEEIVTAFQPDIVLLESAEIFLDSTVKLVHSWNMD